MATFLADVFWFMCDQALEGEKMDDTGKHIEVRLEGTKFSGMEVPTCPSAGACFSVAWGEKDVWSRINPTGRITRPKDRESRDGILGVGGIMGLTHSNFDLLDMLNYTPTQIFMRLLMLNRPKLTDDGSVT